MKAALARVERLLRAFGLRVAAQPRRRLAALCAALCVLALTGTLLALSQRGPSSPTQQSEIVSLPTATPTNTATPTATPKPKPTATQTTKRVITQPQSLPAPPPPPPPPPPKPTATPCPTATPTLAPSPTASATSTATATATSTASPTATGAAAPLAVAYVGMPGASCTPCGQNAGNNPSQAAIQAALDTAAQKYGLPNRLLYAVAWQESRWHQDVQSCDGGVGLMQIQYYYADYFNGLNVPICGVAVTNDNIYTLAGNADLGAKYLRYLECYFAYNMQAGGTAGSPGTNSSGYYYRQAGLAYPDSRTLAGKPLADCVAPGAGTPAASPTPAYGACSLCHTLYSSNGNGPTTTLYQDLNDPAGGGQIWSCPYNPANGITYYELLDLTLSAYNEGATAVYNELAAGQAPHNLNSYVGPVESEVTAFAQGALPR